MHIMARQQRAQSVRAFTPPAAAQFGAQVFVFVGTDAHTSPRLEETDLIRKLGCHSQGRLASSGGRVLVCCARPLRLRQKSSMSQEMPLFQECRRIAGNKREQMAT